MTRVEGRSIARAFRACHPIMFIASGCALSALAATSDVREYQLKAAAVYNLIAFTEWPAMAFKTADTPLVLGVFGQGPVAALLENHVAGETWHGRKITLRPITTPGDARSCHVIYIAPSEVTAWREVTGEFARSPRLRSFRGRHGIFFRGPQRGNRGP